MTTPTLEERVASIEATLPHLATKADLERMFNRLLMAFVGAVGSLAVGIVILLIRSFTVGG